MQEGFSHAQLSPALISYISHLGEGVKAFDIHIHMCRLTHSQVHTWHDDVPHGIKWAWRLYPSVWLATMLVCSQDQDPGTYNRTCKLERKRTHKCYFIESKIRLGTIVTRKQFEALQADMRNHVEQQGRHIVRGLGLTNTGARWKHNYGTIRVYIPRHSP